MKNLARKIRALSTPKLFALAFVADVTITVALAAIALGSGVVDTYDAPGNAGITVVNVVGIEWRGTPGLFLCDGQC